jgi:two-component system, OmpR family, phosphate regulon response regulator PhoB
MEAAGWLASDSDDVDVLVLSAGSSLVEMFQLRLQMDGYRVTAASRLEEWQVRSPVLQPDIVLIDLDDAELARLRDVSRLRSDPVLKNVPLLILSSRSPEELRRAGLTLNAGDNLLASGLATRLEGDLAGAGGRSAGYG